MSNAGAVRAGAAFVEIFANDSKFQQAMTRVVNRMKATAASLKNAGNGMGLTGAAMVAPMLMAVRQAAVFDDAMLGMRASTNMTADQMKALNDRAIEMSRAVGVAPSTIAKAFLALVKAGVDVEQVLGDAGKTAVQFGKLAPEMDMEAVANGMTRASSAFGASFTQVADTISAAADTTETNVANIGQAFNVVAPLAASLGQNLAGTTQALAIFAKSGMEAEEAGTALKMFLLSLTNATPQAQAALAALGLSTESFRDQATRNLLPIADISTMLMQAIAKVDPAVADDAVATIFGARGIKAMKAFQAAGEDGMRAIGLGMTQSKSVAEKFDIVMSGISGTMESVMAAVERLSGAFTTALGDSLRNTGNQIVEWIQYANSLIERFPTLSRETLDIAMNMLVMGIALRTAGSAMNLFASIAGAVPTIGTGVGKALMFIGASPVLAKVAGITAAIGGLVWILRQVSPAAREGMDNMLRMAGLMSEVKKQGGTATGKPKGETKAAVDLKDMMTPEERALHDSLSKMKNDLTLQSKQLEEAGQKAAQVAIDQEQEFDDAQRRAVDNIQELSNSIVEEVDGLGESAFNAAVNAQGDLRDVMGKVDAGILNPEGAKVLSDRIKAQFDKDLEMIREAADPKAQDFGASMGGFGTGEGMGIGSQLAEIIKQVKIDLKPRPKPPGAPPAPQEELWSPNQPNPEWVKQQERRKRQAMQGTSAAAAGVGDTSAASGGIKDMIANIAKTTHAVSEQTPILKRIADGIQNGGLAFS